MEVHIYVRSRFYTFTCMVYVGEDHVPYVITVCFLMLPLFENVLKTKYLLKLNKKLLVFRNKTRYKNLSFWVSNLLGATIKIFMTSNGCPFWHKTNTLSFSDIWNNRVTVKDSLNCRELKNRNGWHLYPDFLSIYLFISIISSYKLM